MPSFKLANTSNAIVECYDMDMPILTDPNLRINEGYKNEQGYNRYVSDQQEPNVTQYFTDLVHKTVIPMLYMNEVFKQDYPITMKTMIEKTNVGVIMFKDEIGWSQSPHEDPRISIGSGVFHLQDCNEGTCFIDGTGYEAPHKKMSGAFWANMQWSRHKVPTVTAERWGYLIVLKWKDINFEYQY
jgi:hypothetical protein